MDSEKEHLPTTVVYALILLVLLFITTPYIVEFRGTQEEGLLSIHFISWTWMFVVSNYHTGFMVMSINYIYVHLYYSTSTIVFLYFVLKLYQGKTSLGTTALIGIFSLFPALIPAIINYYLYQTMYGVPLVVAPPIPLILFIVSILTKRIPPPKIIKPW